MKIIALLLSLYFLVFSFGQLSRFSIEVPEINLYFSDILIAIIVSTWLAIKLIKRETFKLPPFTNQILLFILIATASLALNSSFGQSFRTGNLLSGREMVVAWLYLVRWLFYASLYFVAYDLRKELGKYKLNIRYLLITSGLLVALFGLCQYLFFPDTRFLENFGWDPHYYRLIGTFLDPGFTGIILVLTLALIIVEYFSDNSKNKSWLLVIIGVIVYLALALTYSRASYLAYLASIATIVYIKKIPKFFIAVAAIFVITILLLPRPGGEGVRLERESTVKFRIINWYQSFQIARDHPFLGVGFNAYRYSQRDYGFLEFANWRASHAGGGADSSLLFVLATTGVFGLITYLWFWWHIVTRALSSKNLIILASVVALFVHSFFVNSLFYPWVMGWYWVLMGAFEVKE